MSGGCRNKCARQLAKTINFERSHSRGRASAVTQIRQTDASLGWCNIFFAFCVNAIAIGARVTFEACVLCAESEQIEICWDMAPTECVRDDEK